MIICNSSMNRITSPSASASSRKLFIRSSKSPRNLAPESIPTRSIAMMRLFRRFAGMEPSATRCARPSTTAVFPTPGSPVSTGLFLVRLDSTWITRSSTSSRPIIGSYAFSATRLVMSVPNFSKAESPSSGASSAVSSGCSP